MYTINIINKKMVQFNILKKKSLNLNFLFNIFLYRNIKIYFFKKFNKIFMQEKDLIIRIFFVNFFFFKLLLNNNYENLNFLFLNYKKFF